MSTQKRSHRTQEIPAYVDLIERSESQIKKSKSISTQGMSLETIVEMSKKMYGVMARTNDALNEQLVEAQKQANLRHGVIEHIKHQIKQADEEKERHKAEAERCRRELEKRLNAEKKTVDKDFVKMVNTDFNKPKKLSSEANRRIRTNLEQEAKAYAKEFDIPSDKFNNFF